MEAITSTLDPVAKRIGWLRALVAVTLAVAVVIVGVGSYVGVFYIENSAARYRFTTTVDAAVSKLDANFKRFDDVMRLVAQTYVELNPSLSDWPNAVLPNFYTSAPLAGQIAGADLIAFAPLVKPEELASFEAFAFEYWDNEPNIPPGMAGYMAGASGNGARGVWAVNDTSNGFTTAPTIPYHDTTGRTTWGEGKRIVPMTQLLFTAVIPPRMLGANLYASQAQGEMFDRVIACVEGSSFSSSNQDCGAMTQLSANSADQDFLVKTDTSLVYVNSHRSMPVVIGNSERHDFVGLVGGQFNWGPMLSRIFPETISGIDIVVRYRGFTFTCRIKEGVAEIIGGSAVVDHGDVASKTYQRHKVHKANALSTSQFKIETDAMYNLEMTFYPTEVFMADYSTSLPILVSCCGVLLILLVSLVFVGYDWAVRGEAARKGIVLDTKRRFVRFVSHEIRTPMNAVRLGMTLFSTEIDGLMAKLAGKSLEEVMAVLQETVADWRQIAVDVLDNSEAAVDVLNDMLNYDKIESGSLRLEFSMVPVWNVLQRTFGTFVLQAREKEIVFQLQGEMFDADAPQQLTEELGRLHCVGDATRIAQVLRNLISNSLKFTEKGGAVTVRAEYLQTSAAGMKAVIAQAPRQLLANARAGAVRITVEDDGAGLSPTQVGDICKEGVQFNVNTLQAGGGSGLGLFIGKGIVEQLGGTMRVSSDGLGRGATFVIELPMFRMEGLPMLQGPLSPRTSLRMPGGGTRDHVEVEVSQVLPFASLLPVTKYLLVVDDAPSNRKLLVRILTAKGYVCKEAADGQIALDVYRQMCADDMSPTCVLMDFEMPVMNGPTATKQLREMGCDCYIVGVTGNVMQADVDVFLQHGANAVLAKPLRIEIFESLMAGFGSSNKSHADVADATSPTLKSSSRSRSAVSGMSGLSANGAKVYADSASDCVTDFNEDNSPV